MADIITVVITAVADIITIIEIQCGEMLPQKKAPETLEITEKAEIVSQTGRRVLSSLARL